MIKEVMPLPEMLSTVLFITLQNLDKTFALRIFEAKNTKLVCRWDMFLDLNLIQVKCIAITDKNISVIRQLVKSIANRSKIFSFE